VTDRPLACRATTIRRHEAALIVSGFSVITFAPSSSARTINSQCAWSGDSNDHAFGRRLANHLVEIRRSIGRYGGAGIAGDRGGVRKPARIAVAQANKAAISGVLTEECMQKHVGAMPKADDRVTDAHQRIPNGMPDTGFYFSPVLAMPWTVRPGMRGGVGIRAARLPDKG
jgi:hypothetical protein